MKSKIKDKTFFENKNLLDLIANTLLEEETITKEQIDSLVETGHLPTEEDKEEEKNTDEDSSKKETKSNKEQKTDKE